MATYAIGDVQGCFNTLQKLLAHIQFDATRDTLWFTGDLVNRGPDSLATLRFVKALGPKHRTVLGNHDLHLLARAHGAHSGSADDTLDAILTAPDREELLAWLTRQPLFYYDEISGYALVHASLAAGWDVTTAEKLSNEVAAVIQSNQAAEFFQNMYGNEPTQWQESLSGWDRLRCITNYFTRARFCYADGRLELKNKGGMLGSSSETMPWFTVPNRVNTDLPILFGHWAALNGITDSPNTFALDTGCIWGFHLTAMRLEDQQRFHVKNDEPEILR